MRQKGGVFAQKMRDAGMKGGSEKERDGWKEWETKSDKEGMKETDRHIER